MQDLIALQLQEWPKTNIGIDTYTVFLDTACHDDVKSLLYEAEKVLGLTGKCKYMQEAELFATSIKDLVAQEACGFVVVNIHPLLTSDQFASVLPNMIELKVLVGKKVNAKASNWRPISIFKQIPSALSHLANQKRAAALALCPEDDASERLEADPQQLPNKRLKPASYVLPMSKHSCR